MVSSVRKRLIERIPSEDIVPALLLIVVEAVLLAVLVSSGQFVKLAAIGGIVVVAIFFLWRFFPKKERDAEPRDSESRDANEVEERIVALDRKTLSLSEALPEPLKQKLKEAQAMKHHGNWLAALESYSSAVAMRPDCWPAIWGVAFCKGRLGHEDAIVNFEKLARDLESIDTRSNPDLIAMRAACFNQISALHDRAGHPSEAYKSMKRANDILPGHPVYLANLIGLAVKADKEAEARSWYDLLGDTPDGDGILKKLSVDELNLLSRFPWFKVTFH